MWVHYGSLAGLIKELLLFHCTPQVEGIRKSSALRATGAAVLATFLPTEQYCLLLHEQNMSPLMVFPCSFEDRCLSEDPHWWKVPSEVQLQLFSRNLWHWEPVLKRNESKWGSFGTEFALVLEEAVDKRLTSIACSMALLQGVSAVIILFLIQGATEL